MRKIFDILIFQNHRFKLFCFVLFSSAFSLPRLYAQIDDLKFHHITVEHGLSSNSIRCIFQDSKGFMWFGTSTGLNMYDGRKFKLYKDNPNDSTSISNGWINTINEDRSDTLWIGTKFGGLNKFDRERETFIHYRHEKGNPNSLGGDNVTELYEDKSGNMWVGTEGGGLSRMNQDDPENITFINYRYEQGNPNSLSDDNIQAICEDESGNLWVGTTKGLNKFDPGKNMFTHYRKEEDNPFSLSEDRITIIYNDQSGVLWLGTSNGLNKLEFGSGLMDEVTFKRYMYEEGNTNSLSHNHVSGILEDISGVFWIGTRDGLNMFDREAETFKHFRRDLGDPSSLSDNRIQLMYQDRSGVLWLSTGARGLNKIDRKKKKFSYWAKEEGNSNSLSNNHVLSICEDENDVLWIGTYIGGLNRFDRKNNTFQNWVNEPDNPSSLSNNNIYSLYKDKTGILWVGSEVGLNKFDPQKGTFTRFLNEEGNARSLSHNRVRLIYEDRSGRLWLGTSDGLNRFDRATEQFTHFKKEDGNSNSLSSSSIRAIHEDRSGVFWIGTDGGLNKCDTQLQGGGKDVFTHYRKEEGNPNSLSFDRIRVIYEDKAGMLWIGTRVGLNKFDKETEQFTQYTEKDGLPDNVVFGILEDDDGNLWLSTLKGLSKFNPDTEKFRNYDVNDGLPGDEFTLRGYYRTESGEFLFGNVYGLVTFYPDRVKDNPYIPPVYLTSFKKFYKDIKLDKNIIELDEIDLSYKDNVISFEFAALEYTSPMKNQYSYKLEGFDKDWIYSASKNEVTYTNLKAGNYMFKVKGSNNDDVWNEEATSIRVTITPPFWETLWFRGLCAVIIISIIFGFIKLRLALIRRARVKERKIVVSTFNDLIRKITQSSQRLASIVEQVNSSGEETANSIQEIAQGMSVQFERFQEIVQASQNVSVSAGQVSKKAEHSKETTDNVSESTTDSETDLGEMLDRIDKISQMTSHSAQTIRELGERAERINSILYMISEIVGQTNRLALNAKIQASQAGEYNTSFNVVATEVGNLANRSDDALGEILSIIKEILKRSKEAVDYTQMVSAEVDSGKSVITSFSEKLKKIIAGIKGMASSVNEISQATDLQQNEIKSLSSSIESMVTISEEAAKGSDRIAHVVQEQSNALNDVGLLASGLTEIANNLENMVTRFERNEV